MGVLGLYGQHVLNIKKNPKYANIMKRAKIITKKEKILGDVDVYYYKIYNGLVSTFSIDFNGLIHNIYPKVFGRAKPMTETELIKGREPLKPITKKEYKEKFAKFTELLWDHIMLLYKATRPIDAFIIAIDGLAPYAKIIQQRRRRFTNDPYYNPIFDSNCITPGTEFMIKLDEFLRKKISESSEITSNKIIYSSHLVEGEAEHKIYEILKNEIPKDDRKVHIIHGLDGDLIMLSLVSEINNIVLLREEDNKKEDNKKEDNKEDTENGDEEYLFCSLVEINVLGGYLLDRKVPIKDYVLMSMLMGNDFIPRSPSLKNIDEVLTNLINLHNKNNLNLVIDNKINWKDLYKLMAQLYKNEFNNIKNRAEDFNPMPFIASASEYNEEKKINEFKPVKFRNLWYDRCFWGDKLRNKFIKDILQQYEGGDEFETIFEYTSQDIKDMCFDYLRTLQWNFIYYNEGYKNASTSIGYKYDFAPLFLDLSNEIAEIIKNGIEEIEGVRATPLIPDSFSVLHQLVCVLPLTSKNIVPNALKPLFEINSPIIDLFPNKWVKVLEGSHKEHLTINRIPIPDRQRIINVMSTLSFKPEELYKWIPQDNFILESKIDKKENERLENLISKMTKESEENMQDNSGYNQNRGGYKQNRGNYNQNRGNYNQNRGNYNQNRGNYNQNRGDIQNRGNYNQNRGDVQNRGNYNQNRGNYNQNRGNYNQNRGNYNQNRGNYNQNRGNYNQNRGNYNQNRGNYNQNRGNLKQNNEKRYTISYDSVEGEGFIE